MKLYYELIYLSYIWPESVFLWKTLCCAHILNCNSHDLYISFSPWGRFRPFGKINFIYHVLSSPVYFQKCYLCPHDIYSLEVLWCRLGSHTRLHVPWYTTAACLSLRLLVNLPTQHQEVFKELSSPFPPNTGFKKAGFKKDFLQTLVMEYRK